MLPDELKIRKFEEEFIFSASRSSGPGGQNVNKVSTKVELRFSVKNTLIFSEIEKNLILKKLRNKINKEGELILVSQDGRTQSENKILVVEKFYDLIAKALTIPVKRIPTKPSHSSRIKRLDEKKIWSIVKRQRRSGK
ncbi:MAG: aminoacyl-tRNA hydrolase, partial [Bacteroidia bacterium]|nr:aminoacyl-tRNA hydrolase [Bacteroidia bacterium]